MSRSSTRHDREIYGYDAAGETAGHHGDRENIPHPPEPRFVSGAIDVLGTTLTLVFTENVTNTDETGYTLTANGVERALSNAGGADDTITFTCEVVLSDDVCVVSYDGSGDTANAAGTPLDPFTGPVANILHPQ